MIKFFRGIRQNLLTESKAGKLGSQTGRYFTYAIGEIILVVIGILIALQINNASQKKTNRDHVENILENIYYNLESDMANPVNRFLEFCEFKDSLNKMVLAKELSYEDYEQSGRGSRGLARLLTYEFEPFQFKSQAYERMMSNIEIVPDEYMPIVEMLQDVYGKEVPVVNEVAMEVKLFVDEIDDKYQSTFDWYSETEPTHFADKVNYMLTNPKHFNDVRRHQNIINHLVDHMQTLKTNISIAYSKIHSELMFEAPFSPIVEQFYFLSKDELEVYTGTYRTIDDPIYEMEFIANDYYLTLADGTIGLKFIMVGENRFAASFNTNGSFIQFNEGDDGLISGFTLNRISERDTVTTEMIKLDGDLEAQE